MTVNQTDLRDAQEEASRGERLWAKHLSKQDQGSYCENASSEAIAAYGIRALYANLFDALREYEREHY